ncbi:MAG: hypothetical protein NC204_05965 [Candidatus Amulumruptor caecigallinarius]|nr:hypothetical protein [Candidatus Amulumruptor caecigallinarius]
MTRNQKDKAISAAVTFSVALAILLFLFFGSMDFDRALIAKSSIPELAGEEEIFLEPEILRDLGEETSRVNDAPAPAFKGNPEPDTQESTAHVEPGKNPAPAPPVEKKVSTPKESDVKATIPPLSDEKARKVKADIKNKFPGNNGALAGNDAGTGAGGVGIGVKGSVSGRTFLGCPSPQVALSHKTTVTVAVTIDASGTVVSAKARARSGVSADILRKCEQSALRARWTKKADTPMAKGTITFTITPR